jgi:uncharacterized protein (TIGR02145 family)
MKTKMWSYPLALTGALLILTSSCNKSNDNTNPPPVSQVPVLTTDVASNITQTTAISGGNVSSQGSSAVTARGVCWSISSNPLTSDAQTADGGGTGNFTSNLTGLTPNTPYYVRAYATNNVGTGYGNQVSFTTLQGTGETLTDIDGNVYHIDTIGTQVWMVENLKTTKYNDGTSIPLVTSSTAWGNLTTPGYCWYNNDATTYKSTYGAIYNWYTVHTGKLAPTGWHIPTDAEWTTLITYLGGDLVAGGKMKSTGTIEAGTGLWYSPNTGATNESGFTAVPGGSRSIDGTCKFIGNNGLWWSSSELNTTNAWCLYLNYDVSSVLRYDTNKDYGFSVRCIKDN